MSMSNTKNIYIFKYFFLGGGGLASWGTLHCVQKTKYVFTDVSMRTVLLRCTTVDYCLTVFQKKVRHIKYLFFFF